MIKRGPSNVRRNHARNFIQKQAQARLDETVKAYNHQVSNSLAVNAVEVILYQVERLVGRPCSCSKTNVKAAPGSNVAPVIPHKDRLTDTIDIELQDDDLFGTGFDDKIMNDVHVRRVSGGQGGGHNESSGVVAIELDDDEQFEDSHSQGSVNCGICYRSLRQPGYKALGLQRRLFTNYDVENVDGYHVDSTSAPHAFVKEEPNGFVCFKLLVPKYFNSVTYSIREDLFLLREKPTNVNGATITIEDLRRYAGTTVDIYIRSERFTHVVFEFDLGIQRINANIGGETTTLDYDRLQTMSDIPIVFGPEVSDVNEGDIVCIPERNLYLKIRDKERKVMQDQARLEWVCSTRVLQPTEPLRNIAKGYKLR